jgi:hypothetical protein
MASSSWPFSRPCRRRWLHRLRTPVLVRRSLALDVVVYNRQRNVSTALMQTLQRGRSATTSSGIPGNGANAPIRRRPRPERQPEDRYHLADGESGAIPYSKGLAADRAATARASISDDGNVIAFASSRQPDEDNRRAAPTRSSGSLTAPRLGSLSVVRRMGRTRAQRVDIGERDYVAFQSAPLGTVGGDSPVPAPADGVRGCLPAGPSTRRHHQIWLD